MPGHIMRPTSCRFSIVVLVMLGGAIGVHAQTSREKARDATSKYDAPRAPVITFAADGITLAEAVRLALEHSPQIALQRAGQQFQEGVAQEEQGFFDITLSGTLDYEYRQQELPETRKQTEQEKRTDLQDAIAIGRKDYERAQTLIRQLEVVRNASPGAGQARAVSAIDPDIGAQLETLDLLIAGQPDAATREQLFTIRQNFITRKVADATAAARTAVEGFAGAEQRLIEIGGAPDDEVFINASYDVQLSKRLRNGIVLSPYSTGRLESTNYKGKQQSSDFGGKGLRDLYTFQTGVSSVLPLARGLGASATGAFERAARLEADASRSAVRHQIAATVLETVNAYWRLKQAQVAVDVARDSLSLQAKLLELTKAAIDAGELPAADLARSQAAEARTRARLFDSERGLHEARVNLAIVIGVAVGDDYRTLPLVRDEFPAIGPAADAPVPPASTEGTLVAGAPTQPGAAPQTSTAPQPANVPPPVIAPADAVKMVTEAGTRRMDLVSAAMRERAAQASERGAETDKRPRLDLVNDFYATAIDEGSVGNTLDRWVGPSDSLRLEFEYPFGNNAAEGRYAQRRAERSQRAIEAGDLRRQIQLAVIRTTEQVRQASGRLEQSRLGVDASQKTTDAEVERFRAGDATLIDTLITEQQLVDARLAFAAAQADLAAFLAQLRFETGTLVRFTDLNPLVIETDLRTLPGPETWQPQPPTTQPPPPPPPGAPGAERRP
jgi:outer membrane protein TolC